MTSKTLSHTPGPWRVTFNMDEDGFTRYFITSPAGHCPEVSMAERTSNCVLIESAPLLLAALIAVMDQSHICGHHCDPNKPCPIGEQARAAIAKATGEQR